jgi:hypothetical protein
MLVRERVETLLSLAEDQTFDEAMEKLPGEYKTAIALAKNYEGGTAKETHKVRALAWKTAAKHLAIHGSEQGHDYAKEMEKGHKEAEKSYRIRKSAPDIEPTEPDKKKALIRHHVKMLRAAAADKPFRDALKRAKERKEKILTKKAEKLKALATNPEAQARVKSALEKGAKLTPPSEIKKGPAISPAAREKEADKRKEAPDTAE